MGLGPFRTLDCDSCGEEAEYGDYRPETVVMAAAEDGWKIKDGDWLCPDCHRAGYQ